MNTLRDDVIEKNLSLLVQLNLSLIPPPPSTFMDASNDTSFNASTNVRQHFLGSIGKWIAAILFSLVGFEIIFGNVLVIFCVVRFARLRQSNTNRLFASLSVADLVIGLIVIPLAIYDILGDDWLLGNITCHLWHAFDVFASTASIMHLCVIAFDKWMNVKRPLDYTSRYRLSFYLILIWSVASVLSFPGIFYLAWQNRNKVPELECKFTADPVYLVFSSVVSFYIPLLVMIFAYSRVYVTAKKHMNFLRDGRGLVKGTSTAVSFRVHIGRYNPAVQKRGVNNSIPGSPQQEEEKKIGRHMSTASTVSVARAPLLNRIARFQQLTLEDVASGASNNGAPAIKAPLRNGSPKSRFATQNKAAMTLGIVIALFIVCLAPFFVVNVMYAICADRCIPSEEIVFFCVTWLGYCNSGVNPIVYMYSMTDFRRAFQSTFKDCFGHCLKKDSFRVYSSNARTGETCTRLRASKVSSQPDLSAQCTPSETKRIPASAEAVDHRVALTRSHASNSTVNGMLAHLKVSAAQHRRVVNSSLQRKESMLRERNCTTELRTSHDEMLVTTV